MNKKEFDKLALEYRADGHTHKPVFNWYDPTLDFSLFSIPKHKPYSSGDCIEHWVTCDTCYNNKVQQEVSNRADKIKREQRTLEFEKKVKSELRKRGIRK